MKKVSFEKSRLIWIFLLVATLFCAVPSRAADVVVQCPGGGPGAYASIGAALAALDQQGPNSITVTGTCTENIFLNNVERLLISAPANQTATIVAANPDLPVFQTLNSHGIVLMNLVFQGSNVAGVIDSDQSFINMHNCTIQQNPGDGIDVQIGSTLTVEDGSSILNNGGTGMAISNSSNVTLSVAPNQRVFIRGNGGDGIDVDGSSLQVNFGNLTVENNQGAAIFAAGGRLLMFGGPNGGSIFRNNGEGIDVFHGSSASFSGNHTIEGNGDVGLQVFASSVAFNGRVLPDGTTVGAVIRGHGTFGVNVVRMGEVSFNGPHKIVNNGTSGTPGAGIRADRGSLTLRNGTEVSGNIGTGITGSHNSGLNITGATIANNSLEGVRVTFQSEATFPFDTPMFSGNGGATILCDSSSLVSGQLAGVPNISCNQIVRGEGPPRPGRIVN